jgi:hypothetical protein
MANFELFDYTQTWILAKYSKFVNNNGESSSYKLQNDNWKVNAVIYQTPLV